MPKYIIEDIDISSNEYDKEYSEEKNSNKKNSDEENSEEENHWWEKSCQFHI